MRNHIFIVNQMEKVHLIELTHSFCFCPRRADEESSGPSNTNVKLRYNGEIIWDSPAITKSSCVVDVSYFPFDWQQCNLTFGSWTYNGNQVCMHTGSMQSKKATDIWLTNT